MSDKEAQERFRELAPTKSGGLSGEISRKAVLGLESGRMVMESRGVYIQMVFPNYDVTNSYFEGKVRILNKKTGRKVVVNVVKGDDYPIINSIDKMDSWVLKISPELVKNAELDENGMVLAELYEYAEDGLYPIRYKIGGFSGGHEIYYQLKYWPSKADKPNASIVLAYSYQ